MIGGGVFRFAHSCYSQDLSQSLLTEFAKTKDYYMFIKVVDYPSKFSFICILNSFLQIYANSNDER